MSKTIGGISYKTINGKRYAYYQWCEDGKQRSRRVRDDEIEQLQTQIDAAKKAQASKRVADSYDSGTAPYDLSGAYNYGAYGYGAAESTGYYFHSYVRIGEDLDRFAQGVAGLHERFCIERLRSYLGGDYAGVFILYGLRRTGKTTMIRQVLLHMDDDERSHAAFLQVRNGQKLAELNQDLRYLERQGYRYVFIDEVTLLDDFIEGAALFSDVFASSGMKIVLSGTDSLGFVFSEDEQLYDRCELLHTTFISYKEFEEVLGIADIDAYIRYGGTMSVSGRDYNKASTFATPKKTNEYIDAAIAHNIQHSLKNYQYAGHFRNLQDLYEAGELTSVINRVVEDVNHRFVLDVLSRDFVSSDLQISAKNLRSDREHASDALDRVNIHDVTSRLKKLLDIRDADERALTLTQAHVCEIREYLELLDLTQEISVRFMGCAQETTFCTAIAQPGLRFSQAEALIGALLEDEYFSELSFDERRMLKKRIISEISGRMLEDIILLETQLAASDAAGAVDVFKLQFAVGEFDMVIAEPDTGRCRIYEIKHSNKRAKEQYRHLVSKKLCEQFEHRYGEIVERVVLYRGESTAVNTDGVRYINVEEYLRGLS